MSKDWLDNNNYNNIANQLKSPNFRRQSNLRLLYNIHIDLETLDKMPDYYLENIYGQRVSLFNPTTDQIHLEDIAERLANEPRYSGGAGIPAYSVAQHSILGSYHIEPQYRLHFLFHDAHESWLKDIPKPLRLLLKKLGNNAYDYLADNFDHVVFKKFNINQTKESVKAVKQMDIDMAATELRDIFNLKTDKEIRTFLSCSGNENFEIEYNFIPGKITAIWPALEAKERFIERYNILTINSKP